jgi:chromosome segregation ATPase
MKTIHNFNNFLLESFLNDSLNEEQKKKVGRITVKEKDALDKMSVEELKDLLKNVKDAVDNVNFRMSMSTDQEMKAQEKIKNGKDYAKDIIGVLKDKGGIEKVDTDKIKEEIESLQKELEDLEKENEPINKARWESGAKLKEIRDKKDASEEDIQKAKEEYDKAYSKDIDAMKAQSAIEKKIRDLKKKLEDEEE